MTPDLLGEALRIVGVGLQPFVEAEMRRVHGDRWERVARAGLPPSSSPSATDPGFSLAVLSSSWQSVFRRTLSFADRGYVTDLLNILNRWVNQEQIPAADIDRAVDISRRILRAVAAQDALIALDGLTGVTRPGVARSVVVAPVEAPRRSTSRKPKPEQADWIARAEELIDAFVSTFGSTHQRFGSKSLGILGVCDAAKGAQWSVAMDLHSGRTWLAVNLEGMQYDGWPIARFIERELAHPQLLDLAQHLQSPEHVVVTMWRDAWQSAGRVRITERDIVPTPIALGTMTLDEWRSVLRQAYDCLDPARDHRGRATMSVTLAGNGRTLVKEVSPHLNIQRTIHRQSAESWGPVLAATRAELEPVYTLVTSQSAR